jgi:hypothetical protein
LIDDAGSGKRIQKDLDELARRFREQLTRAMARTSLLVASRIRSEKMTSGKRETVPDRLGVRTGQLRSSTRPTPVVQRPGAVEGGISFGTKYAAVHIGPSGQVTTIRPVRRQWLTIPLDAAKTSAGVARGAARSGMWGDTFVRPIKPGPEGPRLMIFGRRVAQRGQYAGQARGKVVPLFLLVKQTRVRARISYEEIATWFLSRFTTEMRGTAGR